MATIDGRPAQYGITLKQMRDLMEHRGREGVNKVNDLGGVQEICKKLYTSPSEGRCCIHLTVFPNGFGDSMLAMRKGNRVMLPSTLSEFLMALHSTRFINVETDDI
ncbi:hypothetical protein WA026_008941 [Henosepilachna vigintioctopunctata]|uniref:Uncharacterized protein n=1 Tax=Henosepilachna vigintioctopunctata TaxID=420089 RepID=A0AAW1V4F2_9CUCU